LKEENRTIVLYERPHRITKTLEMLKENLGDQIQVSLSRKISKKFEEHIRGSVDEVLAQLKAKPAKGEMVLIIDNRTLRKD